MEWGRRPGIIILLIDVTCLYLYDSVFALLLSYVFSCMLCYDPFYTFGAWELEEGRMNRESIHFDEDCRMLTSGGIPHLFVLLVILEFP